MSYRSFRASKAFTTLVVSIAFFTDILLQNLVVPVLPYALHSRIGLNDTDDIQRWTSILSSAFGAALMVGSCTYKLSFMKEINSKTPSVLFGYLGDIIHSSRALFVFSLAVTFFSTLLFAFATRLSVLLLARFLQGLSTAIVTTVGYVLLTEVVGAGSKQLGKAMSYTSMAYSFGLMGGPVVGGFLYEYCGYFSVFCPVFGVLLLEMILRLMIIKDGKEHTTSPSKVPQAASEYPSWTAQTNEPQTMLTPKTRPAALNSYKTLLLSSRFTVALVGLFFLNSLACGFDAILPAYLRDNFGLHSSQTAALFLSLAAPMLLAPLSGSLTDRYGPKVPTAIGLMLAIPSLITLNYIGTIAPMIEFAVALTALGLAFALTTTPLRVEVSLVVAQLERERPGRFGPKGAYGRAYSLVNLMVASAGLVGPIFGGLVRVAVGWRTLGWINAGCCAAVLVLVMLITGGKGQDSQSVQGESC
ncbi:MFS domain-containing protein [Physcia stellaris]|nr:MFS domain-containing protein [Physcia stellaris]